MTKTATLPLLLQKNFPTGVSEMVFNLSTKENEKLQQVLTTINALRDLQDEPKTIGVQFILDRVEGLGFSVTLVIENFGIKMDITDYSLL